MSQPDPMTNGELERAAVIVMLLGDDEAAGILSHFGPEELQALGTAMCALGEVGPERIAAAIDGFIAQADSQALPAADRTAQVRSTMQRAVGEAKADNLMQRIAPEAPTASLELARWLAPSVVASLVEAEHPQAVAVLLLLLEPEPAAQTLSLLPAALQPQVVERIARMGPVAASAVEMLDEMLSASIAARFGKAALTMGGAREAADLINNAAASVGQTVLPVLTEREPELARMIEAEMFTFAMVLAMDGKDIGRLLRDVESEALIDALAGLPEAERDPVFAAMSSRAADGVRDEIELRGKIRREDVLSAQKTMIAKARELGGAGEISFGSDDGEYV